MRPMACLIEPQVMVLVRHVQFLVFSRLSVGTPSAGLPYKTPKPITPKPLLEG